MIVLILILVGFVLIACGIAFKRQGDRVVDEILALELRLIDRDRKAGLAAGEAVGWHGPGPRR